MSYGDSPLDLIERSSNFTLSLLSYKEKYQDPHSTFKVHQTVIAPLLKVAEECWVYGIDRKSEVWEVASSILQPMKGKYKIDISSDPITGKEYFWNASAGKRGTIVIIVPIEKFLKINIFKHCREAWVFDNYRSGHTTSAINLAKKMIETKRSIVFCLPRNNGIEWMEVFTGKPLVFDLYKKALKECNKI